VRGSIAREKTQSKRRKEEVAMSDESVMRETAEEGGNVTGIDLDMISNATTYLDNAVFQLVCFEAGIYGEMHELDAKLLKQYIETHPERDLAADVYRVVGQALTDCGVRPS
jgi:hypothetical protein